MNYYINSNNGDYITENNGKYILTLIPRITQTGEYMKWEAIEITPLQFQTLKGFIPIKSKKLFGRKRKTYTPTLSNGLKGIPKRTELPTISEARDIILKELGL